MHALSGSHRKVHAIAGSGTAERQPSPVPPCFCRAGMGSRHPCANTLAGPPLLECRLCKAGDSGFEGDGQVGAQRVAAGPMGWSSQETAGEVAAGWKDWVGGDVSWAAAADQLAEGWLVGRMHTGAGRGLSRFETRWRTHGSQAAGGDGRARPGLLRGGLPSPVGAPSARRSRRHSLSGPGRTLRRPWLSGTVPWWRLTLLCWPPGSSCRGGQGRARLRISRTPSGRPERGGSFANSPARQLDPNHE